jgi:NAD(P)-dependent dehydrogenase (short-subunit alcohol dehydrogenase family)
MNHPLFDLSDQVALVTGAASGMGRATAIAFAEAGADLMLADINLEGVERTAQTIASLGRRAIPVHCDVSDPDQILAMFERLDGEYGRIDILSFFLTQQAGQRMLAAGKGSIISIGSLASVTALGRGHIAYSMAMGAVAQMTRELSTEWSGRGVRVNAILPAQVLNPGLEHRMGANPALRDAYLRGIPAGRLGRPEDIKGVALFLASDASGWVTGALIPMDGGNLAMNAGGSHTW